MKLVTSALAATAVISGFPIVPAETQTHPGDLAIGTPPVIEQHPVTLHLAPADPGAADRHLLANEVPSEGQWRFTMPDGSVDSYYRPDIACSIAGEGQPVPVFGTYLKGVDSAYCRDGAGDARIVPIQQNYVVPGHPNYVSLQDPGNFTNCSHIGSGNVTHFGYADMSFKVFESLKTTELCTELVDKGAVPAMFVLGALVKIGCCCAALVHKDAARQAAARAQRMEQQDVELEEVAG